MARLTMGARLRSWRKAAGKTQKEAALMVGASQALWSEWEKGTRRPGVPTRDKIEAITKVIKAAEWVPDEEESDAARPTGTEG
jgi:transcriptional regulator with XRE-family HTH domain